MRISRPMLAAVALTLAGAAAPVALAQPVPGTPAAPMFDPAVAAQAVTALAADLERRFVYPDVAKAYAAMLRRKLASGGYASFPDAQAFADRVTADLQAVHTDGHLRLRVPGDTGPRPVPPAGAPTGVPAASPPPMEQAGWIAPDIAPGIAYVRFNAFMGDPQVLADFAAFLDTVGGAKALIIDARTHRGGGLEEMDILFPRIFARAQAVMVMDTRASVAREEGDLDFASLVRVPGTAEISRAEHRVTPRAGSPLTKTRIYYLTSGRTASAAEHLATVLTYTHRATLIGDVTAGAGNYGDTRTLPGGYTAFIPVGHSYFAGTKGWEGVGVAPDVRVAPERALVEALTREGIPTAAAEAISASHLPSGSMTRRTMPKS